MRILRLIVAGIILCGMMIGRTDAQKPARRATNVPLSELAQMRRAKAALEGLLETWEKCTEELNSGADPLRWCDMYQAEAQQTPLDMFLSPTIASKLQAKLTAKEIESLKISLSNVLTTGYYYGKEKAGTSK